MKSKSALPTRFFTAKDVAERLAVSQRTVRRWIATGELEVVKLGHNVRISDTSLERLIKRNLR